MSTPGVEPGLSRPQRDVLTTRRCGRLRNHPQRFWNANVFVCMCLILQASLAQLVEHALRKRMVRGSIPLGGCLFLFCDRTHMALSSAKLQPPSCMVAGQAKDVGESGLFWELNPGSLAPSARTIPPDQAATCTQQSSDCKFHFWHAHTVELMCQLKTTQGCSGN